MPEQPVTVVVVGAASRDIVDDDPRGWRLGGGVSYSALLLARLGIRVRALIGLDDEAANARELDGLGAEGVDVAPVRLVRGPVFVNRETPDGRVQEAHEVSDAIDVSAIPDGWLDAAGWLLAPVAAELPDAWAAIPGPAALVAVGWQGHLRELVRGGQVRRRPVGRSPVIARADIVGVAMDDIGPDVPLERLAAIVGAGDTLLVSDGIRGGTAVTVAADGGAHAVRRWASIPARTLVDPTGAGDTFLAGVFAARLVPSLVADQPEPDADLRFGAAAASLVCEDVGLDGVPTIDAVLARLREDG